MDFVNVIIKSLDDMTDAEQLRLNEALQLRIKTGALEKRIREMIVMDNSFVQAVKYHREMTGGELRNSVNHIRQVIAEIKFESYPFILIQGQMYYQQHCEKWLKYVGTQIQDQMNEWHCFEDEDGKVYNELLIDEIDGMFDFGKVYEG